VWPRRRDRRREKSAHAITWSRRLFLFSLFSARRRNVGAYALSLLPLSILLPRLFRSHDAFSQACRSPQPRVPRPLPAPAPTEPARARAPCAEARSRTLRSMLGAATLVAHLFASLPGRPLQSHGAPRASRPSAASKVDVLTAASFSLFPPPHSWHKAMLERYLCPHQYRSFVSPSGASRAQALTRSAASQTSVRATSSEKTYIL
jgi:hypothetical protein